MISFRFHLISLTAIFLALALGIVLGTTVVEKATVNVLESRIKSVRADATAARGERDALQHEVSDASRYASELDRPTHVVRLDSIRDRCIPLRGSSGD